jgi:hypothetical protein
VDGESAEILLPLDRQIGDFASRMADVVSLLAVVEQRSQLDVLSDLRTSLADLIRLRIEDPDTADGTLPLVAGAAMTDFAREMMQAAAAATLEPRSSYHGRFPQQADEFVQGLRLGQPGGNGFVLTILSRLPPRLAGKPLAEIEEPFARRVSRTLARAVRAVREAAVRAATGGSFDDFRQTVSHGVSADLCAALAGMSGPADHPRDLLLSFTWSRQWPVQPDTIREIRLDRYLMPTIAEAARIFTETSVQEAFELSGVVIRLERGDTGTVGRATALGFVEGQPRRVLLELTGADYELAIRAHQERSPVRCIGELHKGGRGYVLSHPRSFAVVLDATAEAVG